MNIGSKRGNGYDIGSSLGAGIASGVASWMDVIAITAADIVSGAVAAAKAVGGIHLLPTEMRFAGDMLGLGAHIGLIAWTKPMSGGDRALVHAAMPTVPAFAGGRSAALNGIGNGSDGDTHFHGDIRM